MVGFPEEAALEDSVPEQRAQRQLSAILAADVAGYSRLIGLDEEGTLARLKELRRSLIDPKISEHRGRIVKTMGDGLLVQFASAVDAVRCAVDIQREMAEQNAATDEQRRLEFRIGINVGDIVIDGEDIYGDGVNVAARLEALAAPGSICMSSGAHDHVQDKLGLPFSDMGEQQLKNIARPVRVYSVLLSGETERTRAVLPLPDKPSIAVLPFTNMSGDPTQDYFSDGITENIITELSRFRDLFVIASNSSFAYKGRSVKVQDVARELGVRYVLEGSVQRSNDRVRVTAQLIDGLSGLHLWAQRFDRQVADIFAVQDEVTETIVGTLAAGYGGRLRKAWLRSSSEGNRSQNFQAFDYLLRGFDLFNDFTAENVARARELFHRAIELDPSYAKAHAKIAWAHIVEATYGWSEDYDASLARGREFAAKAIECDDDEAWAHWALAAYYVYTMRHELGLAEFQKAIDLNPNDAEVLTDFGMFSSYAGKVAEGLELARKAMRLNPHFPQWYVAQLGQIYFDARQYEEAITTLKSLRSLDTILSNLYLAASQAHLGHLGDAKKAIARALELDAGASMQKWGNVKMAPYKNAEDLEHFRDGLRKAGLPE